MRHSVLSISLSVGLTVATSVACATGKKFPDRSTDPALPTEAAEVAGSFATPPGNVSVSAEGRIFVSFHPIGKPDLNFGELIDGAVEPFPAPDTIKKYGIHSVLSLRVDRQNRLWLLDYGTFGLHQAQLLAFDIGTRELVHHFKVPRSVAGLGSMLNDLHVSPDGKSIVITDNSIFRQKPGLVLYDVESQKIRKVLTRHPSLVNAGYSVYTEGKLLFGSNVFHGLDPMAFDRNMDYLYFGALNGLKLHRIATADLFNEKLTEKELALRVEDYADKTVSDGISIDDDGNIYLTDAEHSAIVRIGTDRGLTTLLKDPKFRWPDGFSFGPDGYLYFTCAAMQDIMLKSKKTILAKGPYHLFRFKPGSTGFPGH